MVLSVFEAELQRQRQKAEQEVKWDIYEGVRGTEHEVWKMKV